MLAVYLYVTVSVRPCTYMLVCGCGSRARATLSETWSLWPHLLQLPKMTEAESKLGSPESQAKGDVGSVCLSVFQSKE